VDRSKRLLVAIDDSQASNRAVCYVGELLRGTQGFTVFLLHMLGPLPIQLRESRGAETPEGEEKLEAGLVKKQNQQIKKSAEEFRPLLDKAKTILVSAGVPAEAVERDCPVLVNREDLVTDILREARKRDCATIVVGRESFNGIKEIFVGHMADDLIHEGQGFTFWVVE
jgi:nucleotide-binding universal stress UspA family protein